MKQNIWMGLVAPFNISTQVPPISTTPLDLDDDPFLFIEDIADLNLGDIIYDSNIELSPILGQRSRYEAWNGTYHCRGNRVFTERVSGDAEHCGLSALAQR